VKAHYVCYNNDENYDSFEFLKFSSNEDADELSVVFTISYKKYGLKK
jgi:hypothetical protein